VTRTWPALAILALAILPAGARTLDTVDAGDRYTTPAGPRVLHRMAGGLVVAVRDARDAGEVVRELTGDGGSLEGYEKAFQAAPGIIGLRAPAATRARHRREPAALDANLAAARAHPQVAFCNPVFIEPRSGLWMVVFQDVVLRLKPGTDPKVFFGRDPVRPVRGTKDRFVVTTRATTAAGLLSEVERYAADPAVAWAEPNFRSEIVPQYTPDDPKFNKQWHLENAGYNHQLRDADVDATNAWNITQGTNEVVIAIVDNGVEISHSDLYSNIFTNTGDMDNDGVDDDGNGYIDDIHGWNFASTNNDPSPEVPADDHGTPCAGVAAATGDNNLGVAGIAFRCPILPIKLWTQGLAYLADDEVAAAISYAAGLTVDGDPLWRGADVISMSFERAEQTVVSDALDDAATLGRAGKGCVLFAATGNAASGYPMLDGYTNAASGMPAWGGATCRVAFVFQKDSSASDGDDAVWLAFVSLPDGEEVRELFEQDALPEGWTTGGDAAWRLERDPAHAYGVTRYALRSGSISDGEYSALYSRPFIFQNGATLDFQAWVSCERTAPPKTGDWLAIKVINEETGSVYTNWVESGTPGDRTNKTGNVAENGISYPASHPKVLAVGASTDREFRSDYSQYGTNLDFVAPSAGGLLRIHTTYVNNQFTADFNGTSSACPLAAGIGALLLSTDTNLTRVQVCDALRRSCEKIGDEKTYTNGFSAYYGYGRVNAWGAVSGIPYNLLLTNPVVSDTREYLAFNTITARDDFRVESPGQVILRAGSRVKLGEGFVAATGSVCRSKIDPEL
jgi:subtilisin family serine protease